MSSHALIEKYNYCSDWNIYWLYVFICYLKSGWDLPTTSSPQQLKLTISLSEIQLSLSYRSLLQLIEPWLIPSLRLLHKISVDRCLRASVCIWRQYIHWAWRRFRRSNDFWNWQHFLLKRNNLRLMRWHAHGTSSLRYRLQGNHLLHILSRGLSYYWWLRYCGLKRHCLQCRCHLSLRYHLWWMYDPRLEYNLLWRWHLNLGQALLRNCFHLRRSSSHHLRIRTSSNLRYSSAHCLRRSIIILSLFYRWSLSVHHSPSLWRYWLTHHWRPLRYSLPVDLGWIPVLRPWRISLRARVWVCVSKILIPHVARNNMTFLRRRLIWRTYCAHTAH